MATTEPLTETEVILGRLIAAALVGNSRWQEWPEGTSEWWDKNGERYRAHAAAIAQCKEQDRQAALGKLSPKERRMLGL